MLCLYNIVLCHSHSESVASRTSKTDYVLLAEELLSVSLCHFAGSKKKHDTSSVSAAGQWIRAVPTKMRLWQLSQCIGLKCFTVF